ncbi:MAG: N-acetylmuramoyl-L-alanine amidase AmiC [Candidatus Anoxychlamydiales bacterium]|nr:N-acetylmuramoyl-L-alanine amidase AmiC [Candidatus Anoxychlamydiales bacterium]
MIYRLFFLLSFLFSNFLYSVPQKMVAAAYKNKTIQRPVIVLDAGHGGRDEGAKIRYPYLEEKKLTLTATLFAKKYLEQLGYKVVLTRAKDYFIPLKKRADVANTAKAELFVSIHFNSCPNKIAHGIEIYYHNSLENKAKSKNSQNLASCVLQDVINKTNARSRGVRRGKFCVIRETKMPAILIEAGFITNPQERDNIRKTAYLEKISLGIAQGIESFIKKYS